MSRLSTKVALVTGGASGLGRAIAARLIADGARVVITDVQASVGEATATELKCDFILQDVTDEGSWRDAMQFLQKRHQGLHILVNNAGILGPGDRVSPESTSLEDWRRIFAVNVEGVFLGCRAAIPVIAGSGGGSIVNISSIAGLLATPFATAYGASKAAVRQLTKSVAQHCVEKRLRIRCNSVHPNNVRTQMWERRAIECAHSRGVSIDVILKEDQAVVPMGDFTRPEDIAAAVSFLACEQDSRHITGAKLVVDGGTVHCDTYHMSMMGR
ncbi:SDR family oxidoreductase [Peristeroidobacter agariperforans]|uniref:SDR family oxidoreductase n=1 Tax=Peristeroidobacter agariperforans TaxID=268404 RepID=UPI00101C3E9B|nr:SDR family oxidoreductase [Peristeroidobacter agariperforans]